MFKAEGRRAITMIVLSAVLFSLGCGTESPNNSNQNAAGNRNTAVAQNQANANTTPTQSPTPSSACQITDPSARAKAVQAELETKLGVGNAGSELKIEVLPAANKDYLELQLEGTSKGKATFAGQMKLISEEYMINKCIMKVYFVPDGTVVKPGSYTGNDFEWISCDAPAQPCPDGTCSTSCPQATGIPTNTSANSPANTNTNRSNANR